MSTLKGKSIVCIGRFLPSASLQQAEGGGLREPEKRVRNPEKRLLLEAQRADMAWAGSRRVPPVRTGNALAKQGHRLRVQHGAAAGVMMGVHGPRQG